MVFDATSFIVGVVAGGVTGVLAGVVHGLERTADLQERVRQTTKELRRIERALDGEGGVNSQKKPLDDLQRDLDDIHEEIRRMYKKASR